MVCARAASSIFNESKDMREVEMDDTASKGDTREVDDGWHRQLHNNQFDEMEMELIKN